VADLVVSRVAVACLMGIVFGVYEIRVNNTRERGGRRELFAGA